MQPDVHQNVRMVEIAMSLETVTAPLGGREIGVKKVLLLVLYTACAMVWILRSF